MVGSLSVQPGSSACTCAWPVGCDGSGWLVCRGCGGNACDCRCGGCQECSGCKACKEMALEGNTLPKPYYEEDGITIYNADCRDILPHLPKVDLVLTDPPYGIRADRDAHKKSGAVLGHGHRRVARRVYPTSDWDRERPSPKTLETVISAATHAIIWGGNYFGLAPSTKWLVWDKLNAGNDFADCELAWTNLAGGIRLRRHLWHGMAREHSEVRFDHPTQKPLGLIAWAMAQVGDCNTILDPFMGSGTTLVAAKNLGRRAIGIEIEEKYCAIAVQRLAQEVLPLSAPEEPKPEQLPLGLEVTA
jgi:hypothetical protein